MKKKLIMAAGMVIVAAAALCIKVSKESVVSNELFEENVEALTRVENDYQKKYQNINRQIREIPRICLSEAYKIIFLQRSECM